MGIDRTVVLTTQMRRQQFDTPHRCPIAQPEGIALQMLEDMGGRNLGCSYRTATPGCIGQGGHLMARQIALEPVVDGLRTDARQFRDLADGVPLGHPQHGLHALKEACICRALQRFRQSRDIVLIEAQFGWALRDSHRSIIGVRSTYFKKLLLTHLGDGAFDGTRRQQRLQQADWSYACRTATRTVATWEGETFRLDALGACLKPGRLIE